MRRKLGIDAPVVFDGLNGELFLTLQAMSVGVVFLYFTQVLSVGARAMGGARGRETELLTLF